MVGLKKSKQSILFSLLLNDKKENKSLQSMKDPSTIILNSATKRSEPVFLNVCDLLSHYRTAHCLFTYCACHHLGVYHRSVQVYDVEYYYGDGICTCQPYSHVGRLVLSKKVGVTEMTKDEIETKILFDMFDRFTRKDYDLLRHNCNQYDLIEQKDVSLVHHVVVEH